MLLDIFWASRHPIEMPIYKGLTDNLGGDSAFFYIKGVQLF